MTRRILLRKWFDAILKIFFGAYFALTSLYCLLAFLPYTYYSLIKSPAYAWMPWFAHHHALLFWFAALAAAIAYRSARQRAAYFVCLGVLAWLGLFLTVRPFLASVESNRAAYLGSVASLWVIILVAALLGSRDSAEEKIEAPPAPALSYPVGMLLAIGVALLSVTGTHIRNYVDTRSLSLHTTDI